jgi:glycosyltransferase involved in cell wall biosynthesis
MNTELRVAYLAGLFPDDLRNDIEKKSKGVIQYAADALQKAIVQGLDNYIKDLTILNLIYIGSYPQRYTDYKISTTHFSHKFGATDLNVGFYNLPLYKLYSRYINTAKALKKWDNKESEILLIYGIHTPFIKAAVKLKKINLNIKICLIVPDLFEFKGNPTGGISGILNRVEKSMLDDLMLQVDAFVLISKYMYGPLQIGKRPWVCVEGIYSSTIPHDKSESTDNKVVLYSGTLAKRYGILNLVSAFVKIPNTEYRLWICGDGDAFDEINKLAEADPRIIIFGQVKREKVLQLQKEATIVVNPRTSEGDFTKYSFPSKIMEYLASGTPCIMHRLKGIPDEYFEFCFVADEETPEGLRAMIVKVCEMDANERKAIGNKARNFILQHKTAKQQAKKIYDMLINL